MTLLWNGNFETGNFSQYQDNPWDHQPPQEVTIVTSPVRVGGYAFRARINGTSENGQQRAELVPEWRNIVEGDDLWVAFAVYLAPGFPTTVAWQSIAQFKNTALGSPPLELDVESGQFYLSGGYDHPDGNRSMPYQQLGGGAVTGQWVDWLLHVKFSSNPTVGTVDIWRDGVQVLTAYKPPGGTLYPSQESYVKMGIYRSPSLSTASIPTLYMDEWKIGTTRADVEIVSSGNTAGANRLFLAYS